MTISHLKPSDKERDHSAAAQPQEALWPRLVAAGDLRSFASAWMALQVRMLPPIRGGVLILGEPEVGPFAPVIVTPAGAQVSADLSIAAEEALSGRKGVLRERRQSERGDGTQCVALPLIVDERLHGVVAFELVPPSGESLSEIGRRVQWGAAWIENQIRRGTFLPNRQLVDLLDFVAIAMDAPRLQLAMQALANEANRVLGAEWVACGLVAKGTLVEMEALSHGAALSKKAEFVRLLTAAMQECCDQREVIGLPPADDAVFVVTRAHEELADRGGAGAILSVPFARDGAVCGAMTVKLPPGKVLGDREREFCRLAGIVLGPLLELKRRDDRWIGHKVWDAAADGVGRLVGPGHLVLKLTSAALLAAAAVLSLASADYRITAAATLEGAVQRAVSAPIQGYIAQVGPRAGDRVASGDLLARLDDRALKVERARWWSEHDQRSKEFQRALAENDRPRVQVIRAEIEQSQAHIDLIDEQLAHIEIRAPFDGILVRGDLSQQLGAPVQRGDVLFEVAPLDDYRIVLRIDERDIGEVAPGQRGLLVLSALPFTELPFEVSKITPISAVEDGRNTFRVEALLAGVAPAVRPGMQGYGKISTGPRKLVHIVTARLVQWLRIARWKWWY